MNYITSKLPSDCTLATHLDNTLGDLAFADDIVLLDDTVDKAIKHLDTLEKEALKIGLKINIHKTKFVSNEFISNLSPMKVKIERVTKFKYKYLGSQISSSFDDITERTNAAYRTFWKMMKIWKSKDIKEEIKIKIKIFDCTCIPICLYGCESWILTEKSKAKLNVFAMNCYRIILNISKLDREKNEDILKRINKKPIIKIVRNRQLKFLSKILNSNDNVIAKEYILYEPVHGKRKRV